MSIDNIKGFDDIRNLSEDQIQSCGSPKKKAQINDIAQQIIKALPQQTENRARIKQFIEKITLIDSQLEDHPFQQTISNLTEAFNKSKSHKTVHKEKKVATTSDFIKLLNSLDLNSPQLKQNIAQLKSMLSQLKKNRLLTPGEASWLEHFLNYLRPSLAATLRFSEEQALEALSSKSPNFKRALEKARPSFTHVEQDVKTALLKHLKSQPDLASFLQTLPKKMETLNTDMIDTRLNLILSQMKDPHNIAKNFVANFHVFMQFLEDVNSTSVDVFSNKWQEILKLMNQKNPLFGEILKNYSYMNPAAQYSMLCAQVQAHYINIFTLEELCLGETAELKKKTATLVQQNPAASLKYFNNLYEKKYFPQHQWLIENLASLKKPYNQGDDPNYAPDEGICLQNALERHRLILTNRDIAAEKIPMKSTAKARAVRAAVSIHYLEAEASKISETEAAKLQSTSPQKLGLQESDEPLTTTYTALWGNLMDFSEETNSVYTICRLEDPKYLVHNINIQIDKNKKIFRLIDDNLGILEWKSLDDCKKGMTSYLETFYTNHKPMLRFFKTTD